MPSFKKSLIVEQFQGNYLKRRSFRCCWNMDNTRHVICLYFTGHHGMNRASVHCLFVLRAVLESAIPPSLEHLTLLEKQSGQLGMILVIFQRLVLKRVLRELCTPMNLSFIFSAESHCRTCFYSTNQVFPLFFPYEMYEILSHLFYI